MAKTEVPKLTETKPLQSLINFKRITSKNLGQTISLNPKQISEQHLPAYAFAKTRNQLCYSLYYSQINDKFVNDDLHKTRNDAD
jgi:hypothetical protein